MAKYTTTLKGKFYDVLNSIHTYLMNSSASISYEDHEDFSSGDIRCAVNVYERYSYFGGNRCSLSLTLFGTDDNIKLTAITSGGSQAIFFKINTIGENSFLNVLMEIVEKMKM